MPTYVYETIVEGDEIAERFEVRQKMSDPVLIVHPETGVAVRKVLTPVMFNTGSTSGSKSSPASAPSTGGCRSACGCHGGGSN